MELLKKLGVAAGGTWFLLACAGPADMTHPLEARLGWFSYLEANDLRERCADGAERYRLIYNEDYWTDTSSYEIDAATGRVRALVRRPVNLATISLTAEDPLAPLRAASAELALPGAEMAGLITALRRDTASQRHETLRLRSDEVWWLIAGCRDRTFLFDAIAPRDPRWAELTFPVKLAALLPQTPLPAQARRLAPPPTRSDEARHFTLTVTPGGLRPMPKLMRSGFVGATPMQ